jgi:type VI secretion system protein ImpH
VSLPPEFEREPFRFDFYALMRRVERSFPDKPRIGDSASWREEIVSLGEDPYLDFPASSVAKIDRDAQARLRVFVKFLGLLGPQGALPIATTEEAYGWWLARDDAFPRFLDVFNHRFLQLFYRAWADARPIAQHDRPRSDRFVTYVGAAIGIGSPVYRDLDTVPDLRKLGFAGLLAPQAKSASRLRNFLQGLFGVETEIEQFVGSWLVFDPADRTLLGRHYCRLGEDALVGQSVFSVQDKIRVRLTTTSLAEYERLLPSGDLSEPLADAVFFYVGEEIAFDVELAIDARQVKPLELGRFGRLGWTTWVSPRPPEEGTQIRRDARFHPAERLSRRRRKVVGSKDQGATQWPTSASKS